MLWSGYNFGYKFLAEVVAAPLHGKYWSNSFQSKCDLQPLVYYTSENIPINLASLLEHHNSILLKTSALAMATLHNYAYTSEVGIKTLLSIDKGQALPYWLAWVIQCQEPCIYNSNKFILNVVVDLKNIQVPLSIGRPPEVFDDEIF